MEQSLTPQEYCTLIPSEASNSISATKMTESPLQYSSVRGRARPSFEVTCVSQQQRHLFPMYDRNSLVDVIRHADECYVAHAVEDLSERLVQHVTLSFYYRSALISGCIDVE